MDPTTSSLWSTHDAPQFPTLTEDLDIAVVVIGAGITGLTAALRMSDAGLKVVVLEGNTICSGVTGGTTAHVTEIVDTRYHAIASKFGKDGAKLVAESSRAAIDHIAGRVAQLGIDCDLVRVPGYLYTERTEDLDELGRELAAAREAGVRWVYGVRHWDTKGSRREHVDHDAVDAVLDLLR